MYEFQDIPMAVMTKSDHGIPAYKIHSSAQTLLLQIFTSPVDLLFLLETIRDTTGMMAKNILISSTTTHFSQHFSTLRYPSITKTPELQIISAQRFFSFRLMKEENSPRNSTLKSYGWRWMAPFTKPLISLRSEKSNILLIK